ncbi:PqiB family protein [Biformimicrobium ophioploci]|uniref:PqiB family protein n=1 Tax=Biformimicrobium ophioploci TaxID=3036711 RepID=A0ABQ6M0T5_9GAMM|nr:MlaD family protein [Microbulbifer sp. NKW57]GMG87890.1 PqiB family protein [Microbulbifer sp. NKW57]
MAESPPVALVKPNRGLPLVWVMPLIAICVAAWLVYQEFTRGDIRVAVQFPSGEGLVVGKTPVKYSGVDIGVVQAIDLIPGSEAVMAKIDFLRSAEHLLVDGTSFWVVKPEISVTGVRGLETLVSGKYITMEAGSGPRKRTFVALSEAPLHTDEPGLRLRLQAQSIGSLTRGSPVHYRRMVVGKVEDYKLAGGDLGVEVHVFIEEKYRHLVRRSARFWNSSGVDFEGSLQGVKLRMDSLASLLVGGISFNDGPEPSEERAGDGDLFILHPSFAAADAGVEITVKLPPRTKIDRGAGVHFRGIRVGEVVSVQASPSLDGMSVTVMMDPATKSRLTENTRFWAATPTFALGRVRELLNGEQLEVELQTGNEARREFEAAATPPAYDPSLPGRHLVLTAADPGSLTRDAPVYYRRLQVGKVQGFALAPGGQSVEIYLVLEPRYASLVHADSVFWHTGGVRASASLDGIDFEMDSLASLLRGGIAFADGPDGVGAADGSRYVLYPSRAEALREGVPITIAVASADNIRVGAPIRYRGVSVGEVTGLHLGGKGGDGVELSARLNENAAHFARTDTLFWIVRPVISLRKTENLDTVIRGHYLRLEPGGGGYRTHFVALPEPPPEDEGLGAGLHLVLDAARLGSIKAGAPVYYREVKVGEVTGHELGELADRVYIYLTIAPQYATLVRENSRFWHASGVRFDFNLRQGAQVHTESLEALVAGGISFATPDNSEMGREVLSGSHYALYPKPEPEWLLWSPKITLWTNEK